MSRRVRRDSETSTDSWSLVEEDRLDDDFSLNSTDNEGAELDAEPIVEEPITSDEEEEEDTASEKSLGSDSEDSDSDSELSDASEASDVSEVSENEEEVEEEAIDSEDSDLSDAESDVSEDEEEEEEALEVPENSDEESEEEESEEDDEEEEIEEMDIAEAARLLKETDFEKDMKELENEGETAVRVMTRALIFCTMFVLLFPLADVFTSWMLTYRNHRFMSANNKADSNSQFAFEDFSRQSYHSDYRIKQYWKEKEGMSDAEKEAQWIQRVFARSNLNWGKMRKASIDLTNETEVIQGIEKKNLNLLNDILEKKPKRDPVREAEILEFLNGSLYSSRTQEAPKCYKRPESYGKLPTDFQKLPLHPALEIMWFNSSLKPATTTCNALAPVPPAPFSPRRLPKRQVPRHQPCFVHVNQSKWTCQKNLPSVIYKQEPKFTTVVMPRVSYKKKGMGRTSGELKKKEIKWSDVCAKKASQSMRNIPRPTDQCSGSSFRKPSSYGRQSIGYKAPLPCKVPTYKPTINKKSIKPSTTPTDDWHHKRSQHRAQLRSRT